MKEFIPEDTFEETDNKNELRNLLFNYFIYWKWFILSVVLCWAGAWFYLRYATPVYNVSATVMIKDDKKGSRASEMLALEDMGFLSSSGSIENEMEILRSKSLIKQAVTALKIYATYTTKGHIGSRDLYTDSPIAVEMSATDLNKLKTGFNFEVVLQPDSTLDISGNIGGEEIAAHVQQLPILLDTPAGRLTLSLRPNTKPIFDETIYITITPPLQMAKAYLAALSIAGTSNTTSIANINIQTTNKQRGEDFVNKLIEVYNLDANNDKKLIATKTAEFIAKRNHINRFVENNPTWTYEEITPATLPECLEMDKEWYRRSLQREGDAEERDLGDEGIALRTAMEHYEELGLEGGLIRVYGEVVAFTIGDRLSADTYDVHFEKAYGELQGAYAMINREFARWVRARHPEIRYLNREDDMGVEGLRKAKQSYYPDLMVEKHTAVMK